MIQLTTSAIFILSALYTASTLPAVPVLASTTQETAATTTVVIAKAELTTPNDIQAYLRKEYADTPILLAVAKCESDFRQFNHDGSVIRGKVNQADVGVMQINEKYHLDKAKALGVDIYTVEGNAAYAKYLYAKEGGEPWKSSKKCWAQSEPLAVK